MDNGSDVAGTLLAETSPGFKKIFMKADLMLAKGQGNFETLSEPPRPVWFLFKAKCPMIAARGWERRCCGLKIVSWRGETGVII